MNRFAKFVAVVLAIAVIGSFIPVSKAQTTAELNAQIQSLLAMIATLQAQLSGGSAASGGVYTYTADLTLGSKGADVTALQQFLVSKGFLTMPAGASYGYFGALTKSALASYQASVGISPAAGYFGPVTRAHFNAMVAVSTAPVVSGTAAVSSGPLAGGEGILTVEENGSPAESVSVYESDVDAGVVGIKVKAQNSDLRVERVKVSIGTSATAYTKQISALSIWDGSTMLQKVSLNSSTVVKEGTEYFVYFTGLNTVVTKDTTKVYTVKADFYGTVENVPVTITLTIHQNSVRVKDATNLDLYGPGTGFTHAFIIRNALDESAALTISKSANSPKDSAVIADNQGLIDDPSSATVLVFDLKAEDGLVKVDQINVTFTGDAAETTAYLYDGSTLLQSATVSSNSATFTDMEDILQIPADTTKAFTLKVDYSGATTTASTSVATITAAANNTFLAMTSDGDNVVETGSAVSNTIYVTKVSPMVSLVSSSIAGFSDNDATITDTLHATFVLDVKAEGDDVWVPETGAFTVLFGTSTAAATSTNVTVSYLEPSGVTDGTTADKISDGTTVRFTVDAYLTSAQVTRLGSGSYFAYIDSIGWHVADAAAGRTLGYLDDILKTSFVYAPAQ